MCPERSRRDAAFSVGLRLSRLFLLLVPPACTEVAVATERALRHEGNPSVLQTGEASASSSASNVAPRLQVGIFRLLLAGSESTHNFGSASSTARPNSWGLCTFGSCNILLMKSRHTKTYIFAAVAAALLVAWWCLARFEVIWRLR